MKPNSSNLFRPDVGPSKQGGLVIIGRDGSRVHVPDSEVEAFVDELREVRRRQLVQECDRITRPFGSGEVHE